MCRALSSQQLSYGRRSNALLRSRGSTAVPTLRGNGPMLRWLENPRLDQTATTRVEVIVPATGY